MSAITTIACARKTT